VPAPISNWPCSSLCVTGLVAMKKILLFALQNAAGRKFYASTVSAQYVVFNKSLFLITHYLYRSKLE
jgi:hypothetical protein